MRGIRLADFAEVTFTAEMDGLDVSRGDRARWLEYDAATGPAQTRGARERAQRGLDFPERTPVFQRLLADAEGNVWVLSYRPPWSELPYHFEVHDPTGTRVATIDIPFGLLGPSLREKSGGGPILYVGTDQVLVRRRTELDIPVVSVHRLVKSTR